MLPKRTRNPGMRITDRPEGTGTEEPLVEKLFQVAAETFFSPQISGREGWGAISAIIWEKSLRRLASR